MAKAEVERKNFIKKTVPYFATIGNSSLDVLYNNFIANFVERKTIIFKEGDIADSIYLIYHGSCILQKHLNNPNLNFNSEKNKIVTILSLLPGDLAGLESLDYVPGSHNILNLSHNVNVPRYNNSLVVNDDYSTIIKIKICSLNELREDFCESMRPIKNIKDQIIEGYIKKKKEIGLFTKPTYRQDVLKINNSYCLQTNEIKFNNQFNENLKTIIIDPAPRSNLKSRKDYFNISYINKKNEELEEKLKRSGDLKNSNNPAVSKKSMKSTFSIPKLTIQNYSSLYNSQYREKNNKLISLKLLNLGTSSKSFNPPLKVFYTSMNNSKNEESRNAEKDLRYLKTDVSTQRNYYNSTNPNQLTNISDDDKRTFSHRILTNYAALGSDQENPKDLKKGELSKTRNTIEEIFINPINNFNQFQIAEYEKKNFLKKISDCRKIIKLNYPLRKNAAMINSSKSKARYKSIKGLMPILNSNDKIYNKDNK